MLTPYDIRDAKRKHKKALSLCMLTQQLSQKLRQTSYTRLQMLTFSPELTDFIGSTSKMLEKPVSSDKRIFAVGTEVGLIYPLCRMYSRQILCPFMPLRVCESMKLHTSGKVYMTFKRERPLIKVSKEIASRAKHSIEAMLNYMGGMPHEN